MTRIIKNKTRPSRALCGAPLWGAPNDPAVDRNYRPGQHGPTSRVKDTDYGMQLKAMRKLRQYYNVTLRQFSNLFKKAANRKGNTAQNLVRGLESRLDAIVYRANFGRSIFASRQLVSHGHITVNGKKVKIPSYSVSPGDIVAVRDASKNLDVILDFVQNSWREVPDYIQLDEKKLEAVYLREPEDESDVPYPVQMDLHLVVEFFSK